nr:hypothetical protein [Rhodohalobacter barkolensis]
MLLQKRFELLLPAHRFVVIFLIFNVLDQSRFIPHVMSKYTISFLPTFEFGKQILPFDKITAGQFNILNQIRQRNRRVQVYQDMNMVFSSVNAVKITPILFENAPNVFVEQLAVRFI